MIKDKYSRLETAIYAVSWLLGFSMPVCVEAYNVVSGQAASFHWMWVRNAETVCLTIFMLFLANNYILLPKLFFKKKRILYFVALGACLVALWYIQQAPPHHQHAVHDKPPGPRPDMFHITNLIIELCVVSVNFATKVYVHSLRRDMYMVSIQKDRVQSELDSLKYQISPHFLMNTLNNIQSLIESDPPRAYFTVQGLSRMMRYLLYDNSSCTVALQKEVEFMASFIDLMKIRYPDHVRISTRFPADCKGIEVLPLIFTSFLENAFKYGVSMDGESFIAVETEITDGRLYFRCTNTKNARCTALPGSASGIGIKNVSRRLELIYGENYELDISDTPRIYTVVISLPVNTDFNSNNLSLQSTNYERASHKVCSD